MYNEDYLKMTTSIDTEKITVGAKLRYTVRSEENFFIQQVKGIYVVVFVNKDLIRMVSEDDDSHVTVDVESLENGDCSIKIHQ